MRRAFAMAGLAALLAFAQAERFEAASLKPAAPDARGMRSTGGPGTSDPGLLTCENYSLSFLVMMAWDLRGFQLSAPAWMAGARFDLSARIPPGADRRRFEHMLQTLLSERFGLKAHFERKDAAVYELTVARGGPKLQPSAPAPDSRPEAAWHPPAGGPPVRTMAHVTRQGDTLADLAAFVSNQLGSPVIDATGLTGRYDYTLAFLMEPGGRAAGPSAADSNSDLGASLAEALRDQLGLRLEKKKGQAQILVVDHAEKTPVEN